jgi:hypothetical protein
MSLPVLERFDIRRSRKSFSLVAGSIAGYAWIFVVGKILGLLALYL